MMNSIRIALLRGVCQTPAYVAYELGYFREEGLDVRLEIQPTAWVVPSRLARQEIQFAVIPWTRVAAAQSHGEDLVLVCGSGCEEAALVVRQGMTLADVQTIAVPQEGGMKDLTAMALLKSLDWNQRQLIRMPSGDGAILALVGQGADAASMVEPYATMLEMLKLGRVVRRTGDVWPGAPGCSLATSRGLLDDRPDLVRSVVTAYVRGADFVGACPDEAAPIAARFIGVSTQIVRRALRCNRPQVRALHNTSAMDQILDLMVELKYLAERPSGFAELGILESLAGESLAST